MVVMLPLITMVITTTYGAYYILLPWYHASSMVLTPGLQPWPRKGAVVDVPLAMSEVARARVSGNGPQFFVRIWIGKI